MKRAIYLLLICVLLSSCGAFRKVFKLKESHMVEITQDRRTDSVGVTVDKSVTTIKERIDTTVTTPAQVVTQDTEMNMDSLINGMTAIKNDLIDVRLHLNPITGVLSATATMKPRAIPVKLDRVTTKQNDISQQSKKQEAILNKSRVEDRHEEVSKDPIKIPTWIIIVAILLVAGVGAFFWITRHR